ncbi:MAG: hypothetical protein ACK5MA_11040 [Parachlamydiaceae bacterium]
MEIIKLYFLVLLVFPAIFLSSYELHQEPVNGGLLRSISEVDRTRIELLFSTFVGKDPFAYVLFGDKPMALSGGFRKQSWESMLLNDAFGDLFWKRWETWKKYTLGVKFPNYLFLEENFSAFPSIRFIIFINKKLFIKTIQNHSDRFQEITGSRLDPERLLLELENGKTSLQQAIHFNEELLGILLGFGQLNASHYSRRQQIKGPLLIPLALDETPSDGFLSIEEEMTYLNDRLQFSSNEDHALFKICPVEFVADINANETKVLCKKYRESRVRLCELYRDQSYVDVSLKQLMEP